MFPGVVRFLSTTDIGDAERDPRASMPNGPESVSPDCEVRFEDRKILMSEMSFSRNGLPLK